MTGINYVCPKCGDTKRVEIPEIARLRAENKALQTQIARMRAEMQRKPDYGNIADALFGGFKT